MIIPAATPRILFLPADPVCNAVLLGVSTLTTTLAFDPFEAMRAH